jgi:hypothetical protein
MRDGQQENAVQGLQPIISNHLVAQTTATSNLNFSRPHFTDAHLEDIKIYRAKSTIGKLF